MKRQLKRIVGLVLLVGIGLPLYGLPATLTLPHGRRKGLQPLSLADAAQSLAVLYPHGTAQVEAERALVGSRMQYCRRNSLDLYPRAFARGYGYCQQSALALANLLKRLGYRAKVVHCLKNQFADGKVTAHAWVQVDVDNQTLDLDPLFWDVANGRPSFEPLAKVMEFTPIWRIFGGWGSIAINAHRYYTTGRDL